jgi:hypothetical protein
MVRLTIKLLVLAVILHAGFRIVPVFYTNWKFKDALVELATYSNRRTADEVIEKAEKLAKEYELPLDKGDFSVRREKQFTTIATRYGVQLEYFPRQYYPYEFVIDVAGEPRFGEFQPSR